MYPELFTIPFLDWPISSFGAAMAVAFLVGYWIAIPRMQEEGLDPEDAANMLIWIMIGGVFGAKLYYAIDFSVRGEAEFFASLFSRAGMTFYGGLMGGAAAGLLGCAYYKIPIVPFANVAAISVAIGQAIGRIGCFLVGDDYGRATDLPWGVAFPQGLPPVDYPVHPTQLYEFAWLSAVTAFLWARRKKSPSLIGEFLVLNGAGRTVIEHWRLNPRVALGLSEAQWIGIALIVVGIALWLMAARKIPAGSTSADQSEPVSSRS
jgi:phosphatidylglycerol:prolipoprotein diacylglycerol transferase